MSPTIEQMYGALVGSSDGYRRVGEQGIALLDPKKCPSGHGFRWGQRGWAPCAEHRGHPSWTCSCRRRQYLHQGMHVAELPCVSADRMPPLSGR